MPVTREIIEREQRKIADFMVNHGMDWLAPIYDRFEHELKLLDAKEATMDKARKLLSQTQ